MVGHDTHGNVRFLIGSVSLSGHVAYHLQDGLEDVGVVVGRFPLQGTHQSFESHAGVDDSGRKRFEAAVVLHEHEVPDFDDLRVVLVHQFASGHLGFLFFRARVDVDLRAGTAGTRIAHFPEIVMLVAVQDVVFRQELFPVGGGFVVAFEAFFGTSLEDGGIQVLRVDFQHVHQVFPGPGNGFFLEVVAERPVAQHLEHGVVVGVVADLLQVVVLAADAKALLRVGHPFVFRRVVAQNDVLELVHSRIGKHQCGVVLDYHGSGGHDVVTLALEETLERVSDFVCSQHILCKFLDFSTVSLFLSGKVRIVRMGPAAEPSKTQ